MATRRRLLAFLTRAELLQLAADYEHSGLTAKPKDEIIEAIVEQPRPSKPEVLEYFSRNELKGACEELGLDTTGREKQVLIDRLLGREDEEQDQDGATAPVAAQPRKRELPIDDYRHEDVTRKNIPPAKLASEGKVPKLPPVQYAYSPRRPPVLRFDNTWAADTYFDLLEQAKLRRLTEDETQKLREAVAAHQPWLEWTRKQEEDQRRAFAVDPVVLHIHERVSAQAILKIAARQDIERTLFGDPEQAYHEAVQFYRHEIDWTNRLILGDSLHVMASLSRREDLAGKVQMIYVDPPYGIKYTSNFQPEVTKRKFSDANEDDLTRETEVVKAYRDTWHLGIHSYLSYLRERLTVCRELLNSSGSIFVQISDDNVHRVRQVLDDVFGPSNQIATIAYKKAAPATSTIRNGFNYLLWYAKDATQTKTRKLFKKRQLGEGTTEDPKKLALWLQAESGFERTLTTDEKRGETPLPSDATVFRADKVRDSLSSPDKVFEFTFNGETLLPGRGFQWRGNPDEMRRLRDAHRLVRTDETLAFKLMLDDSGGVEITSMWEDTAGKIPDMRYVVQTHEKLVRRCVWLTTDPGDLVLDPTCGGGTTPAVAEEQGRRWIGIDTSRVSISIARQRLLTAKYDFHALRPVTATDQENNPDGSWLTDPTKQTLGPVTFRCRTVPHITLKSIAQNANLDPIFERHESILEAKLESCNGALGLVTNETRQALATRLMEKQRSGGTRAVTDANRRRWELPKKGGRWDHWEVPFDTDPDWPKQLQHAVQDYRASWRAKMDEVNACIAANAQQEELVDQPEVVPGIVRVSGPFTVEAVQPAETSLGLIEETAQEAEFGDAPDDLGESFTLGQVDTAVQNVQTYIAQMVRLLKTDGVRFPNNRQMAFTRLEPLIDASGLHAEGRWVEKGSTDDDPEGRASVVVAFGPQYGPVTAPQVAEVIRAANRRGYDNLVIAGFSFDGAAQADIEESQHPRLHIDMAHIRPDVNPGMAGLLKEQPNSQLFTVFGQPRSHVTRLKDSTFTVTMEGVDIYDPVANTLLQSGATKVAAWFLDGDYDGATFCITQAFFPDRHAWEKISRALKTSDAIDESVFERLAGTTSLPFPLGKHRRVAVKVIDPRGNEVMQVHRLE